MGTTTLLLVVVVVAVSAIGSGSGFLISEEYEQLQPRVGGRPKQFYHKDGPDDYTYGYTNSESFKTEQKVGSVVNGIYGNIDPRGFVNVVQYIADDRGFRIVQKSRAKPPSDAGQPETPTKPLTRNPEPAQAAPVKPAPQPALAPPRVPAPTPAPTTTLPTTTLPTTTPPTTTPPTTTPPTTTLPTTTPPTTPPPTTTSNETPPVTTPEDLGIYVPADFEIDLRSYR